MAILFQERVKIFSIKYICLSIVFCRYKHFYVFCIKYLKFPTLSYQLFE